MAFEWLNEYSVGHEQLDEQHKLIFSVVDKFEIALYSGEAKSKVKIVIDFLSDYIDEHFKLEESLMVSCGYRDYEVHKKMHEQFIINYVDLKKEFYNKGATEYFIIRVDRELRNWWKNHIMVEDRKYSACVRNSIK